MNGLIESYERKLKSIAPMIESAKFDEDTEREIRLRTKASCYRTFLSELKQQCNIPDVSVSLPTEEEMYNELNRKFDLGKNHDDGMPIDDTQIGWEQCYDWIAKRNEH